MFPLGTVLLPHMVLPLHVFEPRYRALMQQVMVDGREFGVVLIRRGHEVGGGEQRYDVGTIAHVVEAEELDDGRWLVITLGTGRVQVERWLPDAPYPLAEVRTLPDARATAPALALRDTLLPRLRRVLAMQLELGRDGVSPTVELSDDPAVACWQVVVVAPVTPLDAQQLLAIDDHEERMRVLGELLADLEESFGWQLRGQT